MKNKTVYIIVACMLFLQLQIAVVHNRQINLAMSVNGLQDKTIVLEEKLLFLENSTYNLIKPTEDIPQDIRANRIHLVDSKGKSRVSMGVTLQGETYFSLGNSEGYTCIRVSIDNQGGKIYLNDNTGNLRMGLSAFKDSGSLVVINDEGDTKTFE